MAISKKDSLIVATIHAATYSIPFLFLTEPSILAIALIISSHAVIDRFSLAKYIVFAKNCLAPTLPTWSECKATGYPSDTPAWLAVWLLIVADNAMHIIMNALALQYA